MQVLLLLEMVELLIYIVEIVIVEIVELLIFIQGLVEVLDLVL
jgi:hypothetical protein